MGPNMTSREGKVSSQIGHRARSGITFGNPFGDSGNPLAFMHYAMYNETMMVFNLKSSKQLPLQPPPVWRTAGLKACPSGGFAFDFLFELTPSGLRVLGFQGLGFRVKGLGCIINSYP